MAEPRDHHPGTENCLHCYLWAAINAYFTDAGAVDPATGKLIYDERFLYGHIADVLAEIIAGIPERRARRVRLEGFDRHVRAKIAEHLREGTAVPSKRMLLQ